MSDPSLALPDDLATFEAACWSHLVRAAADKRAAFNTLVLSTIGLDGAPSARTVVLRRVDRTLRTVHIHTDTRSQKIAELRHAPSVALVGWDPRAHLQVRLVGEASIHLGDPIAADGWARSHAGARRLYAQATAPGTPIATPADFDPPEDTEAGFECFTVLVIGITALEALQLGRVGHRRARFTATAASWLAP
jgi:pyridoxine/pyridoxamine 5'-phosphate oxidase